jgi:hypothetical protein
MPLRGLPLSLGPFLTFSPLPGCHEVSNSTLPSAPYHNFLPHFGLKNEWTRPTQSETRSQISPSSLCFLRYVVTVIESWLIQTAHELFNYKEKEA